MAKVLKETRFGITRTQFNLDIASLIFLQPFQIVLYWQGMSGKRDCRVATKEGRVDVMGSCKLHNTRKMCIIFMTQHFVVNIELKVHNQTTG